VTFARERDMTPIVREWMQAQGLYVREEIILCNGYCDLVGVAFNPDMASRRLARRKDWYPLHDRIISVELKLSRVGEALRQAECNLHSVEESWVAFPLEAARRIETSRTRWPVTFGRGVGLLGVLQDSCEVVIPAANDRSSWGYQTAIDHQVEKFWRYWRAEQRSLVLGEGA